MGTWARVVFNPFFSHPLQQVAIFLKGLSNFDPLSEQDDNENGALSLN